MTATARDARGKQAKTRSVTDRACAVTGEGRDLGPARDMGRDSPLHPALLSLPTSTMSSAWTADANEALSLSLGTPSARLFARTDSRECSSDAVRAPEDKASLWSREVYEEFRPTFTYPVRPLRPGSRHRFLCASQIYGEEEKIYGYKDLAIEVRAPLHFPPIRH